MTPSDLSHAIAIKRAELVKAIARVSTLEAELDALRREEAVSQYRVATERVLKKQP